MIKRFQSISLIYSILLYSLCNIYKDEIVKVSCESFKMIDFKFKT